MAVRPLDVTERAVGSDEILAFPMTVGTVTTRVLQCGLEGPPVILLHGVGARADRWRNNLPSLARDGRRVFALDFPGHGLATKRSDFPFGAETLASWVAAAMSKLEIDTADMVGTSLGGHVAALLALRHPSAVRSLTLVGPTGIVPLGVEGRAGLAEAIVDTTRTGVAGKLRALVHDDALVTPAWLEEEWQINNSGGASEAFRAISVYLRDLIDEDAVGDQLRTGRPDLPVLLIWGEQDVLVPLSLAEGTLRALPDSTELVSIANAGHAPYLEQPEQFDTYLSAFLRAHAGACQPGHNVENQVERTT